MDEFKTINRNLSGSDGLIFIAFLGRETYATHVQNSIVPFIFKNPQNVNQAVKRLLRHGSKFLTFKRKEREKGKGGKERMIYTANFNPIFCSLRTHNIDFDKNDLQLIFRTLSIANDFFPQFLLNIFDRSTVLKSSWHSTLSSYFTFLSSVLRFARHPELVPLLPREISISKETIEELVEKSPQMAKNLDLMAVRMMLPSSSLNPEFESSVVKGFIELGETSSLMKGFHDLLVELKQQGVNDVNDVENYFSKITAELKGAKRTLTRLDEIMKPLKMVKCPNCGASIQLEIK